jgi:hypothetical protein
MPPRKRWFQIAVVCNDGLPRKNAFVVSQQRTSLAPHWVPGPGESIYQVAPVLEQEIKPQS